MAVSGVSLIILRTVTTMLFKLARFLFTTCQQIKWHFDGTAKSLAESYMPEYYERSVHVLDIVARHKFDILHTISVSDFICTHNRFESPNYVFANDHVSLMTVTDTDVVFIEAREKGMHLWKSQYSPFLKNAQMEYGHRLIVIPRTAFHRMAEELGDPKGKLILLFNVGRCGSTLLTQMVEHTGVGIAVSEPDAFIVLGTMYRKRGASEQLKALYRDVTRWICRPCSGIEPMACMIKVPGPSACAMHFFAEVFPNSPFLYMYRDPIKHAQSSYRVSKYLPSLNLLYIMGKYSASLAKFFCDAIGFPGEDYDVKLFDDHTFGFLLLIRTATPYLELYRKGFKIAGIRYEDVIADPLVVCQRLLRFCGLPENLAEKGLKCMEIDSQRNTPVAQDLQRTYENPIFLPEAKSHANQMMLKYGLPIIGEDCLLEGTISKI